MKTLREPVRFLAFEEMETLHRKALRILAEVGMRIDHDEALDYLQAAGCKVDRQKKHVRFPEDLVEKRVKKMRRDFETREFPERMAVRYSHVRFRREPFGIHPDFTASAGGYCVFIYDFDGVRRRATLQDTRDSLKLAAQLDQIAYTGLPVASQDVPLPIRPVRMAAELVKITDKFGGIETLTPFDVEYTMRIGEVVRGSREELRKRPILVGYAEAKTPLTLDRNMCDIMLAYVKRGMPQSLDTMPNAGATAPIHPAATLAVGLAETLGGLALCYAVDEEAVVTLDICPSFADMRTGIFRYAGPERVSMNGARIQMISEYYGCPSGVHGGKTDACLPGVRAGLEKGVTMLMAVLCGAVGYGAVGHLENAVTYSPVQLVLDNEITRYVRRAVQGFEVADEAIDVDLIREVGIGGNYLSEMDTARQFRSFLDLAPFFAVAPWGVDPRGDETRQWENMAREKARQLMSNDIASPLTPEQIKDVDEIVKEAEARLREEGKL